MEPMPVAEHILLWCENSQPHWRRLAVVSVPGNHQSEFNRTHAALNLALAVTREMVKGGDLSRLDYVAGDLLDAAKLMLEWRAEE